MTVKNRTVKKVVSATNAKIRNKIAKATLDGFANLAAKLGYSAGVDNLNSKGGYFFSNLSKNYLELEAMYRGSWVVGAAIDCIAEDMTKNGIKLTGDVEPEREKEILKELTRLGIFESLCDAIKWGRLYGGAINMINIEGQEPLTPLEFNKIGKGQFTGLLTFDRRSLYPDVTNLVNAGRDFGLPAKYGVLSAPLLGTEDFKQIPGGSVILTADASRCLRQIGNKLPYFQTINEQLWGMSVLERIQDRLISFDTVTSSAANLIFKAHLRTVKIKGLRQILAAGGDAENSLISSFQTMAYLQNNQGISILDTDDVLETTNYTYSGLSEMMLQFAQQISGATQIPLVRLLGQSPAGLNSTGESDLRTYYDNIKRLQETNLRSAIFKILNCVYWSLYQEAPPANFDFEFETLWETSQLDKATTAKTITETLDFALNAGVIKRSTAAKELSQLSAQTGIYSNISEEEIKELEENEKEEPPPMPEEALPPEEIVKEENQ